MMSHAFTDLYGVLGVAPGASFVALKRAYYARAKASHPDRFMGAPAKEEEFKRVAHAFDVLSDPLRRRRYDEHVQAQRHADPAIYFPQTGPSIMDTQADDILEELIVGNNVPRNTTLQTLMRDLEQTARFIMFREAKTLYYARHYQGARNLLEQLVEYSPYNILYHYYLGTSCEHVRRLGRAHKHFRICLQLGAVRSPPQQLVRIRKRLHRLLQSRGRLGRLVARLQPAPPPRAAPPAEQLASRVSATIRRLTKEPNPHPGRRELPSG